jgi:dTMP kinase
MLIAVEGIDGSGKGTQSALLVDRLRSEGIAVTALSFPCYGANPFAHAIADYLNGKFGPAPSVAAQLAAMLYAGDRFCNKRSLLANSESGIVVCDRYVDSNIAHQAAKLPEVEWENFIEWLESVEYGVYGLPRATFTFLLSLPVETAVTLIEKKARRNYTELKADAHESDHHYLARCAYIYERISARNPDTYIRIQCVEDNRLLPPELIAARIWDTVTNRLRPKP